jgi:hypothetical protein
MTKPRRLFVGGVVLFEGSSYQPTPGIWEKGSLLGDGDIHSGRALWPPSTSKVMLSLALRDPKPVVSIPE